MKVILMVMLLVMSFFLMPISRAWSSLEASTVKIDQVASICWSNTHI